MDLSHRLSYVCQVLLTLFGIRKKAAKNGASAATGDEPDSKKVKLENGAAAGVGASNGDTAANKEEIKKQMKKLYYYRDMLEHNLAKKELEELLEHNGQEIPSGQDRVRASHVSFFRIFLTG